MDKEDLTSFLAKTIVFVLICLFAWLGFKNPEQAKWYLLGVCIFQAWAMVVRHNSD